MQKKKKKWKFARLEMISLNSLDIFLVPFSEKQILVVLKNVEVNEKKKKPKYTFKKEWKLF